MRVMPAPEERMLCALAFHLRHEMRAVSAHMVSAFAANTMPRNQRRMPVVLRCRETPDYARAEPFTEIRPASLPTRMAHAQCYAHADVLMLASGLPARLPHIEERWY